MIIYNLAFTHLNSLETWQTIMKQTRLVFWLTLSSVSIIVAIVTIYFYLVQKSPLEFHEMDFNQNGYVTFFELIYANAYDTRNITVDNVPCIEYYALKDDKRLKLECDKK